VSKAGWFGTAGTFSKSRLRPTNQNAVTAMQGDVTVTAFQATNAAVNAQLDGTFYNDGASTGGTDATGNVRAFMRVISFYGAPLTAHFDAWRCNDPQCNSSSQFFYDDFGTVNVGETHTIRLIWDGSVFMYGIDGTTRTYDPKPSYPVVKPPVEHFKDFRTEVGSKADGGYGYIAATFDNVYVNNEAITLPRLGPAYTQAVNGDVVTAGVGLRGTGTGTITLADVPAGATIQQAFLYWSTVGSSGTFTAPALNGTPVTGTLIGQSDDPVLGVAQAFAYRADVTGLVAGNGSYTVAGLPAGPLPPASATVNDSQGASLVVIYSLPGAPSRIVTINDGAVTLIGPAVSVVGARLQEYTTALTGFLAATPPTDARATFVVGNGQSLTPDYAGLNSTLFATNGFSGGDGNAWDTRTYDVSTAMAAGDTSARAVVSTGNEALVWVAAILSVPAPVVNVDSKVSVTYSGLVLNRTTNTFDTWATVTNISQDSVLLAPMSLIITSITPSNVTLANPTGQTADRKPFVAVPLPEAGLAPGESVSKILVKFSNPTRVRFSFTSSVLAVGSQ
jgi:hypothetical protein